MPDRPVITLKNFDLIIYFACAKQLLETMQPFTSYLQENFGFRKIKEIDNIYKETSGKVDVLFQSVYIKAISLAKFCTEKKCSKSC